MSKINCPNCEHEFNVEPIAVVGGNNRFEVTLSLESGYFLQARELGDLLKDISKAMEVSAKALGGKVAVMVERIESTGDKVTIGFLVVSKP
jgi:hypothetical protein